MGLGLKVKNTVDRLGRKANNTIDKLGKKANTAINSADRFADKVIDKSGGVTDSLRVAAKIGNQIVGYIECIFKDKSVFHTPINIQCRLSLVKI